MKNGMNKKQIATAIKVSQSSISRELKRNCGAHGRYNYETISPTLSVSSLTFRAPSKYNLYHFFVFHPLNDLH